MTTPVFDPHWMEILAAPFMRNAMVAGLCIAVAPGRPMWARAWAAKVECLAMVK